MRFALSEEQELVQKTTEDVCAQVFGDLPGQISDTEAAELRRRGWEVLVDLGLVGLLVPEELGGSGGTVTDACVVAEVLGSYIAPVPYVGTAIAAASLLRLPGAPVGELGRLAKGEPYSVLLDSRLQEPESVATVAFDWSEGSRGVVLAQGRRPVVHELVGGESFEDIDALHPLCRVDPIAADPSGSEAARRARAVTWTGAAAFLTGLADGAMAQAVTYASQREQYGRPIGSFQSVQHMCAEMLFDVETSRSIMYGASWAVEQAPLHEAERLAAVAKFHAGAAAVRVCETAIQVLGGIGITQEHNAHLRLRSAHLYNAAFGDSDVTLELLAQQTLEQA